MDILDNSNTLFTIFGYGVSLLEFLGWVAGLVAVYLSAKANIWSWPIGIINVTLSFFLFYQVQLYPDMFLQVFFFVTNVLGWWRWTHPRPGEEDKRNELKVSFMSSKEIIFTLGMGVIGTIAIGFFAENLHEFFPALFNQPSAAPFLDSFITVMSVITTFYMIQKKVESWIIWILVDIVATYLYFVRDIKFYSLLYLIFCVIASFGLWNWVREYRSYSLQSNDSHAR